MASTRLTNAHLIANMLTVANPIAMRDPTEMSEMNELFANQQVACAPAQFRVIRGGNKRLYWGLDRHTRKTDRPDREARDANQDSPVRLIRSGGQLSIGPSPGCRPGSLRVGRPMRR